MRKKYARRILASALVAGAFVAGWHLKVQGKDAPQETSSKGATPKETASRLSFHQQEFIHPLVVDVMVGGGVDWQNLGNGTETTVCSLNLSSPYMFDLFENLYRLGRPLLSLEANKNLLSFNVVNRDGRVWVEWEGEHGAFVNYSRIGRSPSGVEIVEVHESGGGSGVNMDVAFFRIETELLFPQKNERKVLTILGTIWLGDRYKGRIVYEDGVLHIPANENRFGGGGSRDDSPLSVPIP